MTHKINEVLGSMVLDGVLDITEVIAIIQCILFTQIKLENESYHARFMEQYGISGYKNVMSLNLE